MFVDEAQKFLPNVGCHGLTEGGVVPGDPLGPLPGAGQPLAVLGLRCRLGLLEAYVVLIAAFLQGALIQRIFPQKGNYTENLKDFNI